MSKILYLIVLLAIRNMLCAASELQEFGMSSSNTMYVEKLHKLSTVESALFSTS